MNDLPFAAPPRISANRFAQILAVAQSPAAPEADALYHTCGDQGIDPAVALAFFAHESSYGTRGLCAAQNLKNWGNVRRPYRDDRATVRTIPGRGPFAQYPTWSVSLQDWCDRMRLRYGEEQGLTTVRQALPIYAPASDQNDPQAYAETVIALVSRWQSPDFRLLSMLTMTNWSHALPWATDDRPRPPRRTSAPTSLTLHYNGPPVAPAKQQGQGLLNQLIADAYYQMRPGGLGTKRGGDGLQYHYVVDVDGHIYQTRDVGLTAWHCGDAVGNQTSLALHLPLGGTQDATDGQWRGFLALGTALIADHGMPDRAVRGHQEWPAADTLCPGPQLMRRLRQWRDQDVPAGAGFYRIRTDVAAANVRERPGRSFPIALAGKAIMWPGDTLDVDGIVPGECIAGQCDWLHRRDGLGFVHRSLVI